MAVRAVLAAAAAAAFVAAQTLPVTNQTVATRACQPPHNTYPFCNTSLTAEARAVDVAARLNGTEIAPQLTARHSGGGSPGPNANVSRLGLPNYDWGMNALHGVQSSCMLENNITYCPTSFPMGVSYGFSWNQTGFRTLGAVISNETRALWLAGAVEASDWSGRGHIGE